jgi:hypothetical protein
MQKSASTALKSHDGTIREAYLVLKKLPLSGGLHRVDPLLELLSAICERFARTLFQKRVFTVRAALIPSPSAIAIMSSSTIFCPPSFLADTAPSH